MFSITNPNECPAKSMMRGWLSFMVPLAWLTYKHTSSITASVVVFFAPPAFAILQGTVGIVRYRVLYGDAPLPLSPAHGVVVVNPNSTGDSIAASCANEEHITGCSCLGGRRWRNTTRVSESERHILAKALEERPLRLLVIGDSLAIGVGTSRSCTPVMPEIIARTLSKALGGRAVYWTCHGEPGASAGWIVRELERGVGSSSNSSSLSTDPTCSDDSETASSVPSEDDTVSDSSSSYEDDRDTLPTEWQEWRDRLHRHRKRFDPDILGPYDVVVVFSGSNDLKSALFPFLLKGEDVHFRKQAKERGDNYANELRLIMEVLRHRMKEGIDEIRENIMEHLNPNSPRTRTLKRVQTTSSDHKSHDESEAHYDHHHSTNGGPLIVLPGLPARALPIFRRLPLRWFAVPIVNKLDNQKRDLAQTHPNEVIFVEAPTVASIIEYEKQQGPIWEQRENEDTLLALRDVHRRTCRRIEKNMHQYYTDEYSFEELPTIMPQHNPPVPPLSERPGPPGSKIFSKDQVHPNDEGYEYWGRYIGSSIVQQWKKKS